MDNQNKILIQKQCRTCLETKQIDYFYKHSKSLDKLSYSCKTCENKQRSIYRQFNPLNNKISCRKYQEKNKENIKKQRRDFYIKNSHILREKRKQYYQINKEKFKFIRASKQYKEKVNVYRLERSKKDINFKIGNNLRRRINSAIKQNWKSGSAISDLGCSIPELKSHLESKFQIGMTWENYGQWHIDHIKPLISFNLSDRKQFLQACNYTNLQPLWAKDNLSKGSKIL